MTKSEFGSYLQNKQFLAWHRINLVLCGKLRLK